jgi:hypothetical protein
MIWYDVDVTLRNSYPGFPSAMTVKWGGYKEQNRSWVRESKSGRSGRWTEGGFEPPPWARGGGPAPVKANVNFDRESTIKNAAGISRHFAHLIAGLTKVNRKIRKKTFNNMTELENALVKAGQPQARARAIKALKDAESNGKLFF